GYFFNNAVNAFVASGYLRTDHGSNSSLFVDIDLFGDTLFYQNVTPGNGSTSTFSRDLPVGPVTLHVPITVVDINVSFKLNINVQAKMGSTVLIDQSRVACQITPNVTSTVSGRAAVGVEVPGAEVDVYFSGSLTWMNETLALYGEAGVVVDSNNLPSVYLVYQ